MPWHPSQSSYSVDLSTHAYTTLIFETITDPSIFPSTGYPGAAEVVNMTAPGHLLKKGLKYSLPCIGDGRQSGTSGSPSILNASPEAAENGNLAILQDGDMLRVDLNKRSVNMLITEDEIVSRRDALLARGGYKMIESHTPYQALFRQEVGPLSEGMVFKRATQFQRVAQKIDMPRDNH